MLKYVFNVTLSMDDLLQLVELINSSNVEEQIEKGIKLAFTVGDNKKVFIAKSNEGAIVYQDIRTTIKNKMKANRITMTTLASYLNVSRQNLSMMMNDETRQIPKKYLEEMCQILGIERF